MPTLLRGEALAQAAVASISFQFSEIVKGPLSFLAAAWALRRHRIISLTGADSNQDLASIRSKIHNLLVDIESNDFSNLQDITYLHLTNHRVLKGYNNFRDSHHPDINYPVKRPYGRTESDAGMINIFYPERLSINLGKENPELTT